MIDRACMVEENKGGIFKDTSWRVIQYSLFVVLY